MKRLIPLLLAALLLGGCTSKAPEPETTYTQIDQETAMEMMTRDDGHVIVDVRTQEEYDSGHIPGAILIPNENIGCDAPEALPDYDQIILIYCRSGNRSKEAAGKLAAMGYKNIYEFGGINTWPGEIVTDNVEETGGEKAVLSFSSFDGGGYEYKVEVEDPSVLAWSLRRDYGKKRDELATGSPYKVIITFTGLRPGTTKVNVYGRSPILQNDDAIYTATVDEGLNVTLEEERKIATFFLYRCGEIDYDTYNIAILEGSYQVSVNDGPAEPIDPEPMDALMQVIDKYDMGAWDGFNGSDYSVLDGESFWMEIRLTDGTSIFASGDNVYPDHYFEAMGEIQEILDGLRN